MPDCMTHVLGAAKAYVAAKISGEATNLLRGIPINGITGLISALFRRLIMPISWSGYDNVMHP